MSEIDIERLKVDADYWDEVAPEGATHIAWLNHGWTWWKPSDRKCGMFWHKRFSEWQERYDESISKHPRPTKTEWVDGLPPVGCECEVLHLGRTWEKCEIVAHVRSVQGPKAVWQLVGYNEWSGDLADKFRPIKTLKQRQREELAEIIAERVTVQCGTMMDDWQYDLIANAILSKYNLTEK